MEVVGWFILLNNEIEKEIVFIEIEQIRCTFIVLKLILSNLKFGKVKTLE